MGKDHFLKNLLFRSVYLAIFLDLILFKKCTLLETIPAISFSDPKQLPLSLHMAVIPNSQHSLDGLFLIVMLNS